MKSTSQPTGYDALDILDSRATWYRAMARHTRGAQRALWDARAVMAARYHRRLRDALSKATYGAYAG